MVLVKPKQGIRYQNSDFVAVVVEYQELLLCSPLRNQRVRKVGTISKLKPDHLWESDREPNRQAPQCHFDGIDR